MLVKGAPVFNGIVLFQLMPDGPKGTKPLITCDDIHFAQINLKLKSCYFDMLKILQ